MIGAHNGPFRKNRGIAQAGLDFDFRANLYQKIDTDGTDMARTSTLSDLVTVSRASTKTNAGGWDFTNGGTVGALTEAASDTAATYSSCGILIEESSTNEIRNPRFEGATLGVIGSGGVLPTNMGAAIPSGASMEIIAVGTESGWPYLELEITGTPSTTAIQIQLETSTGITAADGEDWAAALGVKLTGGDLTNISQFELTHVERTGAGSTVLLTPVIFTPDATHKRYVNARTLTGGGTVGALQPLLIVRHDGSGAVNVRFRIYAPQCEEKAGPTSPIFPPVSTPGASSRANDTTQIAASAWFDASAVSCYVKVKFAADSVGILVYFSDNTFNERIQLRWENDTRVRLGVWSGNVQSGNAQITSVTPQSPGAVSEYAFAVAANDMALSVNGETQVTDSSVTMPSGIVDLQFGADHVHAVPWNGWIMDFRYFPERLTNAQLEALVGN